MASFYLHIDCEMGGRNLKYSLLTAYFLVTDEDMNRIDDLYLQVKPNDGDYIVSGQGMSVNQIKLQEHDEIAISYKEAKTPLFNFLKKHGGSSRLVPIGHGVKGDIQHILASLISDGSWEQFCAHHYIDTSVVLQYLRACGKISEDVGGSVEALATYFEISLWDNGMSNGTGLHDARFDAHITSKIFKKMIELGKK